jgi:hypothetical protein
VQKKWDLRFGCPQIQAIRVFKAVLNRAMIPETPTNFNRFLRIAGMQRMIHEL